MAIVDRGEILQANAAFVSMLGYGSAAEVQGKPIADLPIVLEPAQPIPVGSRTNRQAAY